MNTITLTPAEIHYNWRDMSRQEILNTLDKYEGVPGRPTKEIPSDILVEWHDKYAADLMQRKIDMGIFYDETTCPSSEEHEYVYHPPSVGAKYVPREWGEYLVVAVLLALVLFTISRGW